MALIGVIFADGGRKELVYGPCGLSLLKILQGAGVYLPSVCGGRGRCGKCAVRLRSGPLQPGAADRAFFSRDETEGGFRLACAAFPDGDIEIELCRETGERDFVTLNSFAEGDGVPLKIFGEALTLEKSGRSFARRLAPERRLSCAELAEASKLADAQGRLFDAPVDAAPEEIFVYRERGRILRVGGGSEPVYGAAVDIGTTTLALALLDLRTGGVAARFSAVNRQREAGADVLSRIQKANDGELPRLSRIVRTQVAEGIAAMCRDLSADTGAVRKIAVAGNTAMLHILLGLSCRILGRTPFTPVTLDMVSLSSREIFDGGLCCQTLILPGISAYVGADITAGLFFTGVHARPGPELFMDIGTNGEIALAYEGRILCTATAAGPAFEGGNIRWGTGSVGGAISRARARDGLWDCGTIGGLPPVGICGSGVLDIVYQGLKNGLVQSSGRFSEDLLPGGEIFLAKTSDGRDIVFCQKDVRELQLAKSAVRSGLDALLNHAGLGYRDIETLYLAGGFGFNLNLESGVGVGLIPEALQTKVSLAGNSALGGAVKFLLDPDAEETLYQIAGKAQEFSLPEDRYFNGRFIDNINFD
ncbi:MAG: ASKHA domain-containing protein [Spirochaetaceae bacterium]|nr:ASKHA domain-containing protein [Spirochaetaceae bacterium]